MQPSPRLRRMARWLAGWLLLWFLAMQLGPLPPGAAAMPADCTAGHDAHGAREAHEAHEALAAHEAHHEQAGHPESPCHAEPPAPDHGGHAGASQAHCPVCLHAAAPGLPAPPELADRRAPDAWIACTGAPAAHVTTAAPPPARGPPAFS